MRRLALGWDPGSPISPHVGPRYIFEIGVGTGSAIRYHLLSDPNAVAIGLDIMDYRTVVRLVARELPPDRVQDCMRRFRFCRMDMAKLTSKNLNAVCIQHLGVPASALHHIHFSWQCRTTSKADRGFSHHRHPDGSPQSDLAKHDDRCLAVVLGVIHKLRQVNTHMLVSMEQPDNDIWLSLPAMRVLLQDPAWVVTRGNHCSAASSAMDAAWQVHNHFPWKLSIYVLAGLDPQRLPVLGLCNLDCAHRLEDAPRFHRNLICRRSNMVPGQRVVTDVMEKGRIPYFVFHQFWMSNCSLRQLTSEGPMTFVSARLVGREHARSRASAMLHCRLNHCGEKVMRATLQELGADEQECGAFAGTCRSCVAGKATRVPHNKHLPVARYYNERVHADLVEFEVFDIHGHKYALVLVEDLTRGKWVYPLRKKSDTGAALQTHCRQEGVMAILRADGGGEFGGRDAAVQVYIYGQESVLAICSMYGIRREETVAEVHDQNGVAELAIRRGVEAARTMLYAANLPKELWSYALRHWARVDWCVVNTSKGASPYKLRFGVPPVKEVRELRAFGARVSFRGKQADAGKLDMPGHRGVLLGRNPVNGGYEILDLEAVDPTVVTTVDVNKASFEELDVHHEPVGVSDEDLRLTATRLSVKQSWHYPPVRAVRETMRFPDEQGKGSVWRLYHKFRDDRILHLRKEHPEASWNELNRMCSMEWQQGLQSRAQQDSTLRLRALGDTSLTQSQHGAAAGEKSGGQATSEENSGGASAHTEKKSGGPTDRDAEEDLMSTRCQRCGKVESHDDNPMLLCDACDEGWHLGCLGPNGDGVDTMPSPPDKEWFCHKCRRAGMRIRIKVRRVGHVRGRVPWRAATMLDVRAGGMCSLRLEGEQTVRENLVLDEHEWYPAAIHATTLSTYVNSLTATEDMQHLPTDYIADAPKGMKAALDPANPLCQGWAEAMRQHMKTLFEKGVFSLVRRAELPEDPEILPVCWIYVVKPDKLKARLVLIGNRSNKQIVKPGAVRRDGEHDATRSQMDAETERAHRKYIELETASPTPRMSVWKMMFTIAIKLGYDIQHVDIVSAFTHTVPQRQVFVRVPEYLQSNSFSGYMLVRRNGFGMQESPYSLYIVVQNWMIDYGLVQSDFDPCVYVRSAAKASVWPEVFVIAQVDDFAFCGPTEWTRQAIDAFAETFDIERLGRVSRWQGMEVHWVDEGLFITQTRQVQLIVKRAGVLPGRNMQMPACGARSTKQWCPATDDERNYMKDKPYRSIVGACGYVCQGTRLDCAFSHKEAARYNSNPGPKHWARLLEMVQYLRKTAHYGILLPKAGGFGLSGSCDADYNGCPDERLSSSGVVIDLGGAPIAAVSRTQKWTARSVGQSEHGALAQCAAELLFYRRALRSLDLHQGVTGINVRDSLQADMYSDSNVAMAAAQRPANWMSDKFKHVECHMKFWHQYVAAGVLKLVKVASALNSSDVLTKLFTSVETFKAAAGHYVRPLPDAFRRIQ